MNRAAGGMRPVRLVLPNGSRKSNRFAVRAAVNGLWTRLSKHLPGCGDNLKLTRKRKGSNMAKPPAFELRMGLIKASVWENATKQGMNYAVTVIRLFKNGNEWKESTRFHRDDLLTVAKVMDLAHTWIIRKQQNEI